MNEDSRALCEAYLAYLRLGNEVLEKPDFRVVRNNKTPLVWDANHLQIGPEDTEADGDQILVFLEAELGHHKHRQIVATPFLAPPVAARLALENYEPTPTLQSLLTGPLEGPTPRSCDIRPVASAEQWALLDQLARLNHQEQNDKNGNALLSEEFTTQMHAFRLARCEEVRFFLAWSEGNAVAFLSSWPGPESPVAIAPGIGRVGMVEDLFTHPDHRGCGIARALIHHCVADARARGADAVLIGAEINDSPKAIYAAMGFTPTCLTQAWRRSTAA